MFKYPFNYIFPGNPEVDGIDSSIRIASPRQLNVVLKNGVNFCAWCAINPVSGRKKYCSSACQKSCYSYLTPHTLRGMYLFNQNYLCANCEFDYRPFFQTAFNQLKWKLSFIGNLNIYLQKEMNSFNLDKNYPSEFFVSKVQEILTKKNKEKIINIDHIKAISLGGSARGFNNLQAICYECHKKKTKLDIQRLKIKKSK